MKPSDETSSAGPILVILTVLFLAGILLASVVGGASFVLQARINEQEARVRAELAMVERRVAQMRLEEALALAESRQNSQPAGETVLRLELDAAGQVSWQGNRLSRADLRERLDALTAEAEGPLSAEILADGACPFEQVAPVLEMVREAGIKRVEMRQADPGETPRAQD